MKKFISTIRRKVRSLMKTLWGCGIDDCPNHAALFGVCEEHFHQSMEAAAAKIADENQQKHEAGLRNDMRIILEEVRNIHNKEP